jgi:hypothetical protein
VVVGGGNQSLDLNLVVSEVYNQDGSEIRLCEMCNMSPDVDRQYSVIYCALEAKNGGSVSWCPTVVIIEQLDKHP